ncbi:acyl-CoA dehydrogenase family protein [Thermoflavimicrobium dichotomicum]|uniref:Acyl-CoA dehydrogenase n=1 Tax=Thermoflavimicrobium dichotomicum TaxID=46223 RepID=A0A1I3NP17_9BACL|nr:acyl-CoA dehydrogenase family protein [Thermoflavimicrobium dichotomicum]SFJ10897.1 Acyl-CoA dehydrogenase [Thermoflavimicrobium dichotomicum]
MCAEDLLCMAKELSKRFALRAAEVDRKGIFPEENFAELKEAGFLALTVPEEYGGQAISLYTLVRLLECLGEGDASTALSLGWHLGILMELATQRLWPEEKFASVCQEIVESKKLINRIATEPETGSPSRGGKPQTTAHKVKGGWKITGRKTFASMSYALDFLLVTATIKETEEVGEFLLCQDMPGIRFDETWDTLGMRGTVSHDVIFDDVFVPEDALLQIMDSSRNAKMGKGWLLHIPACYLGIAKAAKNEALRFAEKYAPNSIKGSIKGLPHVERMVGEMELAYFTAQTLLHSIAKRWDENVEDRKEMEPDLAAVKYVVTNTACQIVDMAMRIVGGHSLYRSLPLERYYRDVRGGLHNPPMDDSTIRMLAQKAWKEREE